MALYKRGEKFWAIWSAGGVRYQRPTGTSNRKQAERIEQQFKDEANAKAHGLVDSHPEMTLAALAARFLSEGSPKVYHQERLTHLLPFFGHVEIGQLSKGLVGTFRQVRQQQDKVSPATTNRDISVLRRLLYWATEQNLLAANPLTRVKMERERRTKKPVLTVAEEQLLLAAAAPHLRDLVSAALDTGMRRGELLAQRWEDVELSRSLLFVTRSKTPEGEAREIPLTTRLQTQLGSTAREQGLVFTRSGEPLKWIRRPWAAAIRESGIRRLRFHDLRHTFNTRLMEAGVMQDIRMALMGHSSGQSINAIYTHIELPTKRRAIAQLEAWVREQKSLQEQSAGKEESSATSQTDASAASKGR